MEWLYKSFGLITPAMVGRFEYKKPDLSKSNLSIPAYSLHQLMENVQYSNPVDDLPFSEATLRQIIRENTNGDYETKEEPADHKDLSELVHSIINNELETGDILPENYPVRYLCHGIILGDNWKMLDYADLEKWAAGYGIRVIDDEGDTKDKKAAIMSRKIVSQQNNLFREIVDSYGPRIYEVRSVKLGLELIQSEADANNFYKLRQYRSREYTSQVMCKTCGSTKDNPSIATPLMNLTESVQSIAPNPTAVKMKPVDSPVLKVKPLPPRKAE